VSIEEVLSIYLSDGILKRTRQWQESGLVFHFLEQMSEGCWKFWSSGAAGDQSCC